MTLAMPTDSLSANHQSKLAWSYSLFAGFIAFVFSITISSPEAGFPFATLMAVSAFVSARIAGWIADCFGRSSYGFVACAITAILFSLVLSLITLFATQPHVFDLKLLMPLSEYLGLLAIYFVFSLIYAVPASLVGTLLFQVALLIVRKRQWHSFEQRWL